MPRRDTPGTTPPARKAKTPTAATGKPRARRTAARPKSPGASRRRAHSDPVGPVDRLFDVTATPAGPVCEDVEYVPLEQITLADNPRRDISPEGIDRLAGMLMRSGQLQPVIGRRVSPQEVIVYAGQRRCLAAKRSPEIAGTEGYEGLRPVAVLRVKLLDHPPTKSEIRRIQAQENQYEELSMRDKQDQFADCWQDNVGLGEDERIARVCVELGIAPALARNLRRQLTLPEDVRVRVAERPSGDGLSITMANTLAAMNEHAPELMHAVAERISTAEHHQQALSSMGAFVHRTVVESESLYAVRLDEGIAVLDAHEELERGRAHLTDDGRKVLAKSIGCTRAKLEEELGKLANRAQSTAFKLDVSRALRERAIAGHYAWVYHRGADYADALWVVSPEFVIAAIHEAMEGVEACPRRDESYFGGPRVTDKDTEAALEADRKRRAEARHRAESAANSNLGLGHDIATGILEPRAEQLDAVRRIVALVLIEQYPTIVAYGAGWTDRAQQQPVGDTARFEPRQRDAILDVELARALAEPDPLRGILQIVCRWAAAFVLDRNGVPSTTALGSARTAGKLQRALPDGAGQLRSAVWELMRPMLSPHLAEINRDDFVLDDTLAPAADLTAHRADSALADVDLGEEQEAA